MRRFSYDVLVDGPSRSTFDPSALCRETVEKVNITFYNNGTLMSYRENRTYTFIPEESAMSDNLSITVLNIPLIVSTASTPVLDKCCRTFSKYMY